MFALFFGANPRNHHTVEEAFLEIMQANYRKDVYGEELRRYRKYHLDEPDEN
jgi:hypothetical protein